jgi:outer membrane protein assembly factor BamB
MAKASGAARVRNDSGAARRSYSRFRARALTIVTQATLAFALVTALLWFSSSTAALAVTTGDWTGYNHDAARTGVSSDQATLGGVQLAWTSAELDGRLIYAQPLVVGDRVLAATEGNSLFALDAATGGVVWSTNLGTPVPRSDLPGGNIDPSGITGTPLVDISSNTVYVVAFLRTGPHHELFALDLATGTVLWHRTVDPPGLSPLVEQQRGALALSGGKIYVPYGGLSGDIGQYKGAVVSAQADGTGTLNSYIVPTSRMGGIWNPGGPVVDGSGDLWVVTGNTASRSTFDYGNAVIRLSAGLSVLDYFAPTNWVSLNAADLDISSLGPVLMPGGRVLAVGKSGTAYLLNASNLGHVGAALATTSIGSAPFGTAAVMGSRVFVPCSGALKALDVSANQVQVVWSVSGGAGSPIIAAGYVWTLAYDGKLKAVDPANGSVVFTLQFGKPASRFITLAAANGLLFVPDGRKITAVSLHGPPSITSLSPKAGSPAGRQTVIINGMGFSGASAVTFGGTPAAAYTVNSPSRITATTPAHALGTVDVVVTNAFGSSDPTGNTDDYTYANRYEQTDANIVKTGTWPDYAKTLASGGSYGRASSSGATATIYFNGTRLDWIAMKGTTTGKADVYVDGALKTTINLAAATGAYQVNVWSTGNLSDGDHYVRIVRSAGNAVGKYVTLDAVDIWGTISAPPPSGTRFEQTDTNIVKTGVWADFTKSAASGGSYGRSSTSGASATIYFTGTRLDWIAMKGTTTGIADVYLDGVFDATIDLTASTATYQVNVWSTGTLSSGTHHVEIVRNSGSGVGKYLTLDAVEIWGTIATAP